MTQGLLFPDPRPLVERLGRDFFRQLPERPGIYLMRGAADALLYVGKAKNLRKRLGSYRVANPDRMARRHLRLLRAVERIEIQECADERAALQREAELLRTLRPRFNRAGTWTAPAKFLAWNVINEEIHFAVTEVPEPGWRSCRAGAGAHFLRASLVRVLWMGANPGRSMAHLPAGWFRGQHGERVALGLPSAVETVSMVDKLVTGETGAFSEWLVSRLHSDLSSFDLIALQEDLELLTESFG
jgi:predicted GIY-YIG superfamily endonuclease